MTEARAARDELFADLVREHQVSLRVFVRSLGVESGWVDDLAQDAFVVAYREMDSYDPDRDFGKWLRGIARNLVRNELRKQGRHRRILHESLSQHLLDLAENEKDREVDVTQLSALRDCVEQLPGKSRELVRSRYFEGWDATILADKFEMKAATVRQTLLRIRRQLYQCVNQRVKGV
ncbi:MAG: sigma-70 family RNA polymerase sigma factor [Verrucomicrobiales bacterium]|nr:sigma-70 family RNA polymerase sigma factor [Verrucomicrobiales bacterium]MBT5847340.1 sigma-70 family RNA polymerase sigma factor [Verrucomicrobiales bacterium]